MCYQFNADYNVVMIFAYLNSYSSAVVDIIRLGDIL